MVKYRHLLEFLVAGTIGLGIPWLTYKNSEPPADLIGRINIKDIDKDGDLDLIISEKILPMEYRYIASIDRITYRNYIFLKFGDEYKYLKYFDSKIEIKE